jgi:hypothetical protein
MMLIRLGTSRRANLTVGRDRRTGGVRDPPNHANLLH